MKQTFRPNFQYAQTPTELQARDMKWQNQSIFQNAIFVGVAVVLPPPENAGTTGVTV